MVRGHKNELGNYVRKDVKHIMLKLKILHEIAKAPSYSYSLIERLDSAGSHHPFIKISRNGLKNDIYNTIGTLEKSGYIKAKPRIEDGKLKNYYHITPSGRAALKEAKALFLNALKEAKGII